MGVTSNADVIDAPEQPHNADEATKQTPVELEIAMQQRPPADKRGWDRIKNRWARIDSLEVMGRPFEERASFAAMSLRDADYCHLYRTHPTTLRVTHFSHLKEKVTNTELELRLNALFMAPEIISEQFVDNLVEVGMVLAEQIGPSPERDFHDIDRVAKVHDIIALEALWRARTAANQQEVEVAKVMLGDSIAESIREVVSFAKRLEQSQGYMSERTVAMHSGALAEFMLVTWERLNLYIHSNADPDVLGRVYVRSSTWREDRNAPASDRSIDAVIMNLNRQYIRPQQYKSGNPTHRVYDRMIEVVHIPSWEHVLDDILVIARHFDTVVSSRATSSDKERARAVLGEYFERARVEKVVG